MHRVSESDLSTDDEEGEAAIISENPKSTSKLSYINKDWSVVLIENIEDKNEIHEILIEAKDYKKSNPKSNVELTFCDNEGYQFPYLFKAVEIGNIELVQTLLYLSETVNPRDKFKKTPLHYSSKYGHIEITKLLVNKGGNTLAEDEFGMTPVHIGAFMGHKEVVEILLSKESSEVNILDRNYGQTPLHFAARKNNVLVAQFLVDHHGASLEIFDKKGRTPLHIAQKRNHKETISFLLSKKKNIETFKMEVVCDLFKKNPMLEIHEGPKSDSNESNNKNVGSGANNKLDQTFPPPPADNVVYIKNKNYVRKRKPIDFTIDDIAADAEGLDDKTIISNFQSTIRRSLPKRNCKEKNLYHEEDEEDKKSSSEDEIENNYFDGNIKSGERNLSPSIVL